MDLTNHYQSPHLRPLPHYRTYFPALFRSCNPFVRSLTLCPRRIAFLLIFLTRTWQTAYFLLIALVGLVDNTRIRVQIAVYFVLFTVELWNLHRVVEAEGEGVLGTWRVPAGAFTLFVFWILAWIAWISPTEQMGMRTVAAMVGVLAAEVFWVVVIAFVARVASKEPADQGLSLV